MRDYLLGRMRDKEDSLTERKPDGVNSADIRRTLVAFANSVSENQRGVLFIGMSDEGEVRGVTNPDSLQKKVRELSEKECYPPIKCQIYVLDAEGGSVLAIVIEKSPERPHFSGPAYIRRGSQSVVASEEVYKDLIASRNTKAGAILRAKGKQVTFNQIDVDRYGREGVRYSIECNVEECDAHVVDLKDTGSGRYFSISLEKIRINKDQKLRRMMIEAIG